MGSNMYWRAKAKQTVCPFKKDNCGHVDSGDVIRAKQQPTEELQRTEEYVALPSLGSPIREALDQAFSSKMRDIIIVKKTPLVLAVLR